MIKGIIDGRWNGGKPPHTHKGIAYYLSDQGSQDTKNARRTVNGIDHWEEVASNYRQFLAAVLAAA